MLKRVFQCLSSDLRLSPEFAGTVINACCVLHNFRLSHGYHDDIVDEAERPFDTLNENGDGRFQQDLAEGRRIRNNLMVNFFRSR